MPPAPTQFIDADGRDTIQILVRTAPLDGQFHRTIDRIPTCSKGFGDLSLTQLFGPTRQEPSISSRHGSLALGPGNAFDFDPTVRALHTTHGINEINQNTPKGDKLETTGRLCIIAGTSLATTGTNWTAIATRPDHRLKDQLVLLFFQFDVGINKTLVFVHAIEYGLQLHPDPFLADCFLAKTIYQSEYGTGCTHKSRKKSDFFVPGTSSLRRWPSPTVGTATKRRSGRDVLENFRTRDRP